MLKDNIALCNSNSRVKTPKFWVLSTYNMISRLVIWQFLSMCKYPCTILNEPLLVCLVFKQSLIGPVHRGVNHVPRDVSDCNPLPDWVCDLHYMYVHSQALQLPSRSQTGSAHCKVIFCSYCTDIPMHGISKMHTHESRSERALCSQVLRIKLSRRITIQIAPFLRFKSLIWKNLAFTKGKIFQIRKESESRSETAFGTWFAPLWTGPLTESSVLTLARWVSSLPLVTSVSRMRLLKARLVSSTCCCMSLAVVSRRLSTMARRSAAFLRSRSALRMFSLEKDCQSSGVTELQNGYKNQDDNSWWWWWFFFACRKIIKWTFKNSILHTLNLGITIAYWKWLMDF